TAPKLTVQGIPAERLVGKAAVKGGVLEYSLEGKTLGGSFELKGKYPGAKKEGATPPAPAPVRAGWGVQTAAWDRSPPTRSAQRSDLPLKGGGQSTLLNSPSG